MKAQWKVGKENNRERNIRLKVEFMCYEQNQISNIMITSNPGSLREKKVPVATFLQISCDTFEVKCEWCLGLGLVLKCVLVLSKTSVTSVVCV